MQYCQHVLGIGHFFRSMEIASACASHEVLFVEGGKPLEAFAPPAHVRRVFLPPLMMDEKFEVMETKGGSLRAVQERRRELLLDCYRSFRPRVVLVELFPFGRKRFRFELVPLLDAVRAEAFPPLVACSLRDILVEKEDRDAYEGKVLEILNDRFNLLLVHSDPRWSRLEETFRRVGDIRIPLEYTGYVARRPPREAERDPNLVVASSGGGKVGGDLLRTVVEGFAGLKGPRRRLKVFTGPFMEEDDRAGLLREASKDLRASVRPFAPDFLAELARASVSVSMAGYNTSMDILSSGVKAIVHPFGQNREQGLRARKLEAAGVAKILDRLDPSRLTGLLEEALEGPAFTVGGAVDLNGAASAARLLQEYAGP